MTAIATRDLEVPLAEERAGAVSYAAEVEHASLRYGDNVVLRDVSLRVGAREIVALIGRSGSGKSTLLRLLAGLSTTESGSVRTAGHPAVSFQEPRLFPWRTVLQNVAFGLVREKVGKTEARERARRTLDEVGLSDKTGAWPAQLSGGQAQRVSLARALVARPQLLLLDEPFGALDALTRRTMHELLIRLWRDNGFGALLVTHDVDEALRLADRVVVLAGGEIVEDLAVPRPRQTGDPDDADSEIPRLRARLLTALGVADPAH
ncbi:MULTISPECIES: ABC transporter ATP-binding protein [Gordonia]|uniref:ABC-type nitrate/sulfonate/bicarbonate transport system, ATPase component n=1 Tax=Gordonia terrae C-6 TaxID=1316928 RepID=R7Y7F2_9ACTN|nr:MULTISPECIES: ABC transporter ATP-binding protein [Gordonia]AFR50090.1 ABC-type nitrate/sulfonate/bicarbonate transport system, ATPase component [Gordonia sp. KTR9]EON31952.1 ABC-type nitrate/sulfonate/bicarbonate transport system, ATPase component [Gordonia terrae C-6]